jgi:hypothetical protein
MQPDLTEIIAQGIRRARSLGLERASDIATAVELVLAEHGLHVVRKPVRKPMEEPAR